MDWLGLKVPEPMYSFGLYCEDDEDEIHRRLFDILRHYGKTFRDLEGRVRFISRVGEENEMVTFRGRDRDTAKAVRTSLFNQVEDEVENWGHQLIILDTAADVFAGNENIRPQVRAFVTQIRRLALINNGGVVLNSHPSKSAMADGSGFSGSTAWNGSVRNRLYLTAKKQKTGEDEAEQQQTNERVLKVMKSNYGPFGAKIPCRWEQGCFVNSDGTSPGSVLDRIEVRVKLLQAARYLVERGTFVAAAHQTRASLTALAQGLPSCKGYSFQALTAAQEALEREGKLVIVELGPQSKRRRYIRPDDARYPGEDS
jgi:RecA-family ATPase